MATQLVMHFIQKQVTQSFITMNITGAWICGRRMERLDVVMLVNLILVLGPITGAFAQTNNCSRYFTVGGDQQAWTVPSNPDFYQTWSASIQFLPGDCLWFNRVTNGSIYDVTAQDYNSCNILNPLAYFYGSGSYGLSVGPFPFTQTYPQSYHFVEADATSCTAGMKFDAIVYDPSSVPPPPAPSPTTSVNASTTPTPPVSPPGPPTPATPPLVGQAVPTAGSGTSSKLSAGAKVGIALAGIATALGVGGIALIKMNNTSLSLAFVNLTTYQNRSDASMGKCEHGEKQMQDNLNQKPLFTEQP